MEWRRRSRRSHQWKMKTMTELLILLAVVCFFEAKMVGIGGHVAESHLTANLASFAILALQQLIPREVDPLHSHIRSSAPPLPETQFSPQPLKLKSSKTQKEEGEEIPKPKLVCLRTFQIGLLIGGYIFKSPLLLYLRCCSFTRKTLRMWDCRERVWGMGWGRRRLLQFFLFFVFSLF
ncbi:hypothetical protein ACE6H2_015314 [Prunus campanulata]